MRTKKFYLALAALFIFAASANLYAQDNHASENRADGDIGYSEVEVKPTFQGGTANDFAHWVTTQLKYPEEAIKANASGRAVLCFNIGTDGKVSDVKILKSTGNEGLDSEALRVIKSSPDWKPGYVKGEAVQVKFVMPVVFGLN